MFSLGHPVNVRSALVSEILFADGISLTSLHPNFFQKDRKKGKINLAQFS